MWLYNAAPDTLYNTKFSMSLFPLCEDMLYAKIAHAARVGIVSIANLMTSYLFTR